MAQPLKKLMSCVVLDLDGTLLNTGHFLLLQLQFDYEIILFIYLFYSQFVFNFDDRWPG